MGGKSETPLISVQESYWLYPASNGVITCDNVIKVPLAYEMSRQAKINGKSYNIIPVVEFVTPVDLFEFKIITNEGITVEPFTTPSTSDVVNPYERERVYFVLPKGTNGIKEVAVKSKYEGYSSALEFGVMPPPYNYDNALFGVISSEVKQNAERISQLEQTSVYLNNTEVHDTTENFFRIVGSHEDSSMAGWGFKISNPGKALTLINGDGANAETLFSGVNIAAYKVLGLTYDRSSSVCNLYGYTTTNSNGRPSNQTLLASGFCYVYGNNSNLHLIIDETELNPAEIASGYIRSYGELYV